MWNVSCRRIYLTAEKVFLWSMENQRKLRLGSALPKGVTSGSLTKLCSPGGSYTTLRVMGATLLTNWIPDFTQSSSLLCWVLVLTKDMTVMAFSGLLKQFVCVYKDLP